MPIGFANKSNSQLPNGHSRGNWHRNTGPDHNRSRWRYHGWRLSSQGGHRTQTEQQARKHARHLITVLSGLSTLDTCTPRAVGGLALGRNRVALTEQRWMLPSLP